MIFKNKKGISLIILIITMLVLSILATVVVTSFYDVSLVDETDKVIFKSNMLTYMETYDIYLNKKILSDTYFDETKVNLTYEDSEYTDIFGIVPDEYKEGLKVIKGKLVYITDNETEAEIIQELGMIPSEISVRNRLIHCVTNNVAKTAAYQSRYTASLSAEEGYTLQKVIVVMGGVNITASAYNEENNTITIESVTDNVIITATTNSDTYTITNELNEVVNSNTTIETTINSSYTAKLSAKTGHKLTSVSITMAGLDITDTVYDKLKNVIEIEHITGDVIITASATANVYSVINVLEYATTSNSATSVQYGNKYEAKIAPNYDYMLDEVKVLMNNLDISNSAYNKDTNIVKIEEVTGNVTVVAKTQLDTSMVPTDFYYVGGTKSTGLVISDDIKDKEKGVDYKCDGNQFVWVPVDYVATGEIDKNNLDTGFLAVFQRGTPQSNNGVFKMTGSLNSNYSEPYKNGYENEATEYYAMCQSVQKYHGFYIGRFEAGDGDAREARQTITTKSTVVSKKDVYVYNYVPWALSTDEIEPKEGTYYVGGTSTVTDQKIAGAVYLSQSMYPNHKSVVSTLCYGVQWDATMNFVATEKDITDSVLWGNYSDSQGDATSGSGTSNMQYKTGVNSAWKAKNIYDLAGNVSEWTMEANASSRVDRGGNCNRSGSSYPSSDRGYNNAYDAYNRRGFRVALYIK